MASPAEENSSNWVFDYASLENLPPLDPPCFHWPPHPINVFTPHPSLSVELDDSFANPDCMKEHGSRKRLRSGSCGASDSKAYKEKIRRDRLNDRQDLFLFLLSECLSLSCLPLLFQELCSILEPGRPPKMDKAVILSDAVRMVIQLREEAQKLKESYDNLQAKVIELKTEKTELRDEKLKLKAEKEKIEQRVKALSTPPGFLAHPPPIHAPFAAPSQVVGSKLVPFVGYPGIPMWQLMPPTAVDTSEDHALRPPVA
ncbi:hypothetical protein BUALT_Bualt03G0071700 [Buddleja alternifolia]|uniref:BHLH domain-containing protein n=1 Tax=Buddleja alternifolia TaxID=168488 RepID=A0AAV6XRW0_9LAMI|nr:hypothetical protein BUALT_Bualt03G0071700 [Buddleja alternifolia]